MKDKRGKRNKKERFFVLVTVIATCLVLFVVSGQQGCEMPGFPGFGPRAEKMGIDFSLISGVGYLSAGKTLNLDETFFVGIKIENYDKKAKSGIICIRDTVTDTFGGISSEGNGECKTFNVKAAEIVTEEAKGFFGRTTEQVKPGKTEIYFPEMGEYSYRDMPSMLKPYQADLIVSVRYPETTMASGTIAVPDAQQPIITQDPAPIAISVAKSVHKVQEAYKISLDIRLRKQQEAKIFSNDFSRENVTYFNAELAPHTIECKTPDGKPALGLIDFEAERLIKCSSLVYLVGKEESYPLIITLNYGVELEKSYSFNIKTEEII